MNTKLQIPSRFYSLDLLRGIAALVIVFWHWQHFFFYKYSIEASFVRSGQPFYELFYLFYLKGDLAVRLFFSLSGFIFFWLYSLKIEKHQISMGEFFVLRYSRLYPLHILTLVLVAILQYVHFKIFKHYFVYAYNDAYHFILQILFASSWGFERDHSFNGPIWSVSIEILLYLIFYMFCFYKKNKIWYLIVVILAGFIFSLYTEHRLGEGVVCFFIGAVTYRFYIFLFKKTPKIYFAKLVLLVTTVTFIIWCFACIVYNDNYLSQLALVRKIIEWQGNLIIIIIVFPLTILSLALLETIFGSLGKRMSFIGNLSYSSYLIHFPLQLLAVIIFHFVAIKNFSFNNVNVFCIFFMVLIVLSLASNKFIEIPLQNWLRRNFMMKKIP